MTEMRKRVMTAAALIAALSCSLGAAKARDIKMIDTVDTPKGSYGAGFETTSQGRCVTPIIVTPKGTTFFAPQCVD